MHVHRIGLRNFRNYCDLQLELNPGITVFVGRNGQGKTNLLETLVFLATSRSPRCGSERELIRHTESFCAVRADYTDHYTGEHSIELLVGDEGTKQGKIDGVRRDSMGEWLGRLSVVSFFPQDIDVIAADPGARRQFLNIELSKINRTYYHHSLQYRRALQQRNALLKDIRRRHADESLIAAWDQQLAQFGALLIAERSRFIDDLQPLAAEMHRRLAKNREVLSMQYLPGSEVDTTADVDTIRLGLLRELERSLTIDLQRTTTTSGPHRDDILFTIAAYELRRFGSQGQQRTAALAVKLALAELVRSMNAEPPILLLDDALSELDLDRRAELMAYGATMEQMLLTTTDIDADHALHADNVRVATVHDAQVTYL